MFTAVKNMRLPLAAIALTILPLATPVPAHADSYTLSIIAYTQSEDFYGIDATGDFVVNLSNNPYPCGSGAAACFATYYVDQSSPVISTSPPALNYDDGSSCTPIVPAGMGVYGADCNSGHEIYGGIYYPAVPNPNLPNDGEIRGIWTGRNLTTDYLGPESFDGGFINNRGDAVFIDGLDNTLDYAFDLTTATEPEPSSLVLLGTGCLALLGTLRRRFSHI